VLWAIGLVTALLTAYYMSRQVFLVFYGEERFREAADADHPAPEPHESPWLMTVPLVVLAGLSIVGGIINLPFDTDVLFLEHWLEPVVGENQAVLDVTTGTKIALAIAAIAAALVGIGLAARVYLQKRAAAVEPEVLAEGWYYDSTITAFMGGPGRKGFEAVTAFDETVIDGAVNGVGAAVRGSGRGVRVLQTGFVRSYALGVAIGAVGLLVYFLTRAGV
jgi:NADH-quinone oxidoreductase subunit L